MVTAKYITPKVFTIHADVQTGWRRKIRDVRVLDIVFKDRTQAEGMLANVRRTMPRAFIKTNAVGIC